MHLLSIVFLSSAFASPPNFVEGYFDNDRTLDMAIGSTDGRCGQLDVWRSADGSFTLGRRSTSLSEPSLSVVPSTCVPDFGLSLQADRGDVLVIIGEKMLRISESFLARKSGTIEVDLDLAGLEAVPPSWACEEGYLGDGGGTFTICDGDTYSAPCEPCCGAPECCLPGTNSCE